MEIEKKEIAEIKPKSWVGYLKLNKINFIIRLLTISDVTIISSFGLISPIFAVFITDSIKGSNVGTVGFAAAIYLLSRSIFQIPFSIMIDRIKGEKDDFWAMFLGSIAFSIIPLFYLVISTPFQLYFIQFLYGTAAAIAVPPWYAIFTRHIDKNYEGIEWGVYLTLTNLVAAGAAAVGGFLAYHFGFESLFIVVSAISLIGSLFLIGTRKGLKGNLNK